MNGHQLHTQLRNHPRARLVGVSAFPKNILPEEEDPPRIYRSLEEMLDDPEIELISLCSPRRTAQAHDAILCLRAGRHVLAEKPCALNEPDLDRLLAAASASECRFHEMSGSAFEEPWAEIGRLVKSGALGKVCQIFAQKSYPLHLGRPEDAAVDGGIFLQAGIHAARWIEHALGLQIHDVRKVTSHADSGMEIAGSALLQLNDHAHGVLVVNSLNPRGFPHWGNDSLRVWGTRGFVEATDGGGSSRIYVDNRDLGPLQPRGDRLNWFDLVLGEILDRSPMPFGLEQELHPLRALLRAKPWL